MLHFKKLLFSLTYLSGLSLVLSSCSYEITIADLSSLWETTWGFEQEADYQFDANYVEVVDGKARLKPLDLNFTDFSGGTHVGSHGLNNKVELNSKMSLIDTHVNTIFPGKSTNLVGYWRLEGNLSDESGNENNGTVYGDVNLNQPGNINEFSGQFDGVDDYIYVGNPTEIHVNQMTISLWAYIEDNSRSIITKGISRGGNSTRDWDLFGNGTHLKFMVSDGANQILTSLNNGFPSLNEWHHIVATWDGTTNVNALRLYVDGTLFTTGTASATNNSNLFDLYIGGQKPSQDHEFKGKLEEIAIWNTSISNDDVTKLYDSQKANYTELSSTWTPKWDSIVGYWKMDGNWQDSSGNGNHGTPAASPRFVTDKKVGSHSGMFDGVNDYISIPHNNKQNLSTYTISHWVKKEGPITNGHSLGIILSKAQGGSGYSINYETSILQASKRANIRAGDGSSNAVTCSSNTIIEDNNWYHLSFVAEQIGADYKLKIYINGTLDKVCNNSNFTPNISANNMLSIGTWFTGPNFGYFPGKIDDVAIWDKAFDSNNISQIYNRQKQKYASHYDSEVIDLGSSSSVWPDLSWSTSLPFGKELVGDFDNDGNPDSESSSDYSGLSGDLSDELVGYWSFNEKSLNTGPLSSDFQDNSYNNNHGIETGGVEIDEQCTFGHCAKFDGVDAYIEFGADSSLDTFASNQDFSICSWVYNAGTAFVDPIFAWGSDLNSGASFQIKGTTNELQFSSLGGTISAVGNTPLNLNTWYFSCLSADRDGNLEFYLNGESDGVTDISSTANEDWNRTSGVYKAATSRTNGRFFTGSIDELSLWNKALTSIEIQQLYRRGANRVKLQVKSCVDSTCECKSYGPGGTNNDCDGDTIVNTLDHDDSHKAEFIGPGGDGTTYYSELYNRPETEVGFQCALNTTDSNPGICVPDEISLTGSSKPTGPEFLNLDYTQFVKPPANRYAQYRVYMEADENTACGVEPCLPELSSVSFNPQGTTKYFGETQSLKPIKALYYKSISNVEIDADNCVKYQLSPNDSDYYWWNGAAWVVATDNNLHVSTKEDVKAYMTKYAADRGPGNLHIKAFLSTNSDQTQGCEIRDFDVFYSTKL